MTHSVLHTVNQSPFNHTALSQCLAVWQPGDAIVLLENGVYSLLEQQPLATQLTEATIYALECDVVARGIQDLPLINGTSLIDYDRFVSLCTEHTTVQSWY